MTDKLTEEDLRVSQLTARDIIVEQPATGLFSTMSFGKTVATLSAIKILFERGEVSRVLIVAPKLVARETWPAEIDDWEHTCETTFATIAGNEKARLAKAKGPEQVHIISQDNFVWLVKKAGKKWPYDMVVVDDTKGFKKHARVSKIKGTPCVQLPIIAHHP